MNTDAITKVEQACADLIAQNKPVTFTEVAARAGLGRTTLYRNTTLRALIEEHRHHTTQAGTISGLAEDVAALRTALETIAGRVRRHEEQLRQITKPKR